LKYRISSTAPALCGTSTTNTPNTVPKKPTRVNKDLPTLARACDRLEVSDQAAAAIASAVLQDFGLSPISPELQSFQESHNFC
jgi:hypothetical protein